MFWNVFDSPVQTFEFFLARKIVETFRVKEKRICTRNWVSFFHRTVKFFEKQLQSIKAYAKAFFRSDLLSCPELSIRSNPKMWYGVAVNEMSSGPAEFGRELARHVFGVGQHCVLTQHSLLVKDSIANAGRKLLPQALRDFFSRGNQSTVWEKRIARRCTACCGFVQLWVASKASAAKLNQIQLTFEIASIWIVLIWKTRLTDLLSWVF